MQIGALLMMSGVYLIKMASGHCEDEYVDAANLHLFKLLMCQNTGFCDMCGHIRIVSMKKGSGSVWDLITA